MFAVKFDVGNNEFKLLPSFCSAARCQRRFTLVNIMDSLTLMAHGKSSKFSYIVDAYSLDEDASWVLPKMYNIGVNDIEYARLAQGFEYGGETVFIKCGKFICYDDETDTQRHICGTHDDFSKNCFRYNPCLVLLPGMKFIHFKPKL